jgi:hypothetical protein
MNIPGWISETLGCPTVVGGTFRGGVKTAHSSRVVEPHLQMIIGLPDQEHGWGDIGSFAGSGDSGDLREASVLCRACMRLSQKRELCAGSNDCRQYCKHHEGVC